MLFVYIEKVLDLWVQLMRNGGKNKSVVFIILFSVNAALHYYCIMFTYLCKLHFKSQGLVLISMHGSGTANNSYNETK